MFELYINNTGKSDSGWLYAGSYKTAIDFISAARDYTTKGYSIGHWIPNESTVIRELD